MNIINRLKKLESKAFDDSSFCACYPAFHSEIYLQDLGEDSENTEPTLSGEPVPDVCSRCQKLIEKRQIIIQFVDQTTKTRFPNEWKSSPVG